MHFCTRSAVGTWVGISLRTKIFHTSLWKFLWNPTICHDFASLSSDDVCLLGRNQLVANATPADFPGHYRRQKIHRIQVRYPYSEQQVNPYLLLNLILQRGQNFLGRGHTESSTDRSQQQGQESQRRELHRRSSREESFQGQHNSQRNRHAEQEMRCACDGPHFWRIHTRDQDLTICKLHQAGEIRFDIRNGQTFRQKNDWPAHSLQGRGHRIIIADGVLPLVHHRALIEDTLTNRSASTPTKIFRCLFTEHS